jgi:hypothetical protein
MYAYAQFNRW